MSSGDRPSVLARVQALAARIAGPARTPPDAGPDTPLGDGGFWLDSVDLVEVIVACETEFAVSFEGETDLTAESMGTVRTLADLVLSKGPR
jgi:acyl carrier protein